MLTELAKHCGVLLDTSEKLQLERVMFPGGKLASITTAQSAPRIAALAGLGRDALKNCRFIMVEESGSGPSCPFSGEKLAPVIAVYKARDFAEAFEITRDIYEYQGKGHSVGIHTRDDGHIMRLGLELDVCRVIVNQAHAIATGGSFDNGLPFSLSLGCGTWGRNGFSENLNYRHFLNTTRIARVIPEKVPAEEDIFGAYWRKYGA
jgi:sulfoacetaldehyde dehydrogenase